MFDYLSPLFAYLRDHRVYFVLYNVPQKMPTVPKSEWQFKFKIEIDLFTKKKKEQ